MDPLADGGCRHAQLVGSLLRGEFLVVWRFWRPQVVVVGLRSQRFGSWSSTGRSREGVQDMTIQRRASRCCLKHVAHLPNNVGLEGGRRRSRRQAQAPHLGQDPVRADPELSCQLVDAQECHG